jgi:polar amino acid transport system substrate-binding protein
VALVAAGCGGDDSLTGGFEVDLSKELAKRLGLNQVSSSRCPSGRWSPAPSATATSTSARSPSPRARQGGRLHRALLRRQEGVLVKKGIKVASVDDAKKLQWGAQINPTGAGFLADKIQPDKETRIFDKTVDAFAALNAGQIQAIMLDTPIVLGAVENKQVKDAEVAGQFKTGEVYGAVVNRGSKNLDAFNQVIRQMKADGTRDRLFKQYFAKQSAVPPEIPS